MKIALGLFHFNPHWNADPRSGHRHCTEAFGPFLRTVADHPSWHVNIEISGCGLEFVNNYYPAQIRLLRTLVQSKQVELISSLYTPNIWIAFPHRDLIRSVQMNRRCLEKLGFQWTRVFFAQEAFFGLGVGTLHEYFDTVVCKDDYLEHQCEFDYKSPCFRLGDMKVVVASNHLVNELARSLTRDARFQTQHHFSEVHIRHLENQAREISDHRSTPSARGHFQNIEWLWYHCGDGNYVGTIFKPADLEQCYYDQIWADACISQVCSYETEGFRLGTIGELVNAIDYSGVPQLPPLFEGSWNAKNADGVFCWMGRNSTRWENDLAVLTAVTRARRRVVRAEKIVSTLKDSKLTLDVNTKLDHAWSALLTAQISDCLGWTAGPRAVPSAMQESDRALMLGTQVIEALPHIPNETGPWQNQTAQPPGCQDCRQRAWPTATIFGAEGSISVSEESAHVRIYECEFSQAEEYCGVRFPFDMNCIVFCPSGLEEHPISIPLTIIKAKSPTLPLANGMIQLADDLFLVKDTQFVHAALRINRSSGYAEFATNGLRNGRSYHWRFLVVAGTLKSAVAIANSVNSV
jgi:alpha-amylase/alpha-mannosidase (GH57 family)